MVNHEDIFEPDVIEYPVRVIEKREKRPKTVSNAASPRPITVPPKLAEED